MNRQFDRLLQIAGKPAFYSVVMFLLVVLQGCYGGDLETDKARSAALTDLRSNSTGNVELSLERLDGADEDGSHADMVFTYSINGIELSDLPPGARLVLTIVDSEGNTIVVSDALPIEPDQTAGELVVSVPTTYEAVTAIATIEAPEQPPEQDAQPQGVVEVITGFKLDTTVLSAVNEFSLFLVPDSYSTEQIEQRRKHNFSVRAYHRPEGGEECVSISGLEENLPYHFVMKENSIEDVESPVTVDAGRNDVNIFLVLDASYSIRHAQAEGDVKNAVSYAVSNLPNDYTFDYRQFTGDIEAIDNIGEYKADESESATALYYAIDTVLQEIEARGVTDDFNVIVGFTDGLDLSSPNHYEENFSTDGVKEYVRNKIINMRSAPGNQFGLKPGPVVHMVSLGDIPDSEITQLNLLAEAGGGLHRHADQRTMLEPVFRQLANRIMSTYHLQYNSQQISQINELELVVTINDVVAAQTLPIRNAGGVAPPDQQDCASR